MSDVTEYLTATAVGRVSFAGGRRYVLAWRLVYLVLIFLVELIWIPALAGRSGLTQLVSAWGPWILRFCVALPILYTCVAFLQYRPALIAISADLPTSINLTLLAAHAPQPLDVILERDGNFPAFPHLLAQLDAARAALAEGRAAMRGIQTASPAPSSLEQGFSNLLEEVTPGRDVRLRLFRQGKPWPLNPAIQEQVFLIGREAIMNALRHSNAKNIEVELQYTRCLLRLIIRDNGCGIDPDAVQERRDSHWGLGGMRKRAKHIDAQFEIWSRRGTGTEVHVVVRLTSQHRKALVATGGEK